MAPSSERSDARVVGDVLAGDRDAYRLLVRRYQDVLYTHALRMSDAPDAAADLVQRAFVRGYERLEQCDPERVGAWLFRILANLAKDELRGPRRREVSLQAAAPLAGSASGPEDDVARNEFRERLEAALNQLTPEQREAFVLKHVDGLPYLEIARILDVPVDSLKMRVHRARSALRDLLEVYA